MARPGGACRGIESILPETQRGSTGKLPQSLGAAPRSRTNAPRVAATDYALAANDDGTGPALYAGGIFTIAGGNVSTYIAKWFRPTDCNGLLPLGFSPPPRYSGERVTNKGTMGAAGGGLPHAPGITDLEDRSRRAPALDARHVVNLHRARIVSVRPPNAPAGRTHAALQLPDGTTIDLGTLAGPNGDYSEAVAMNKHGEVIGWSEPPPAFASTPRKPSGAEIEVKIAPARVPFFWTRDTGMHDLYAVLEPGDPASRSLHIEELHALSDDRIVTGTGIVTGARGPFAVRVLPPPPRPGPAAGSGQHRKTLVPRPRCAGDFNANGVLESEDFFEFLAAFFAGDPRADVNQDGTAISHDFFEFLTALFAGCP